jgi:hypothetical protein
MRSLLSRVPAHFSRNQHNTYLAHVAPWWLVLLLHAGTLLHAAAATPDQPAWLMSNVVSLLVSFAISGLFGWLARHALPAER